MERLPHVASAGLWTYCIFNKKKFKLNYIIILLFMGGKVSLDKI